MYRIDLFLSHPIIERIARSVIAVVIMSCGAVALDYGPLGVVTFFLSCLFGFHVIIEGRHIEPLVDDDEIDDDLGI